MTTKVLDFRLLRRCFVQKFLFRNCSASKFYNRNINGGIKGAWNLSREMTATNNMFKSWSIDDVENAIDKLVEIVRFCQSSKILHQRYSICGHCK